MPGRDFYRWEVRSFTVRLALDVVENLAVELRHPRFNPAEEQGGILYGQVAGPNSVEITGFEFIRSRHHRGAPYDLSLTERLHFERRVRSFAKRDGPRPVGYFRTHMRPGLFLDESDFALMKEAFSEGPGIALAIRTIEPGRESAGIFYWEGSDMDRSQTKLMFPFSVDELRLQGPIDHEESAPVETFREASLPPAIPSGKRTAVRSSIPAALIWGLAAGVLAFAALSSFHRGGNGAAVANESTKSRPAERAASETTPPSEPSPQSSQVLYAPPAAFDDNLPAEKLDPDDQVDAPPPAVRSPFGNSERRTESPSPTPPRVETAPAPASPPAVPAVVAHATPPPLPDLPANKPISAFADLRPPEPPPPAREPSAVNREPSAVNVDVSVEPKEAWLLKRLAGRVPSLAGHVPLLGRLPGLRHNDVVVSARPARDLTPQIPARVSRDLADEVRVDVEASIDDSGVVRSAEATQGAGTDFGPLAVAKVRSVPWRPARSGDHSVPMDVVVHYRFNPTH